MEQNPTHHREGDIKRPQEGKRMQRPRKHMDQPAKAAAYRERLAAATVRVDRAAMTTLRAAVDAAAAAGDPTARQVRAGTADALLRNLARFFAERAK
jgi:hypothetical protein